MDSLYNYYIKFRYLLSYITTPIVFTLLKTRRCTTEDGKKESVLEIKYNIGKETGRVLIKGYKKKYKEELMKQVKVSIRKQYIDITHGKY